MIYIHFHLELASASTCPRVLVPWAKKCNVNKLYSQSVRSENVQSYLLELWYKPVVELCTTAINIQRNKSDMGSIELSLKRAELYYSTLHSTLQYYLTQQHIHKYTVSSLTYDWAYIKYYSLYIRLLTCIMTERSLFILSILFCSLTDDN